MAQFYTRHGYAVLVESQVSLDGTREVLLNEGAPLPARSSTIDFPCAKGRNDCRIFRTTKGSDADRSLIWLHFDVPEAGVYQLQLEVDSNYDVTATLSLDTFSQGRSSANVRV